MFGWRAKFTEEFVRDGWTLHLWRNTSHGIEVARGELTIEVARDGAEAVGLPSGIYLPHDAYSAIASAIDPPAHAAELRRLEEALGLERERVNRVLDASLSARDWPNHERVA